MPKIVLATINARHIHASLGLRCLLANMGDLQSQTEIREFTLESRPVDIAEQLLAGRPAIIGLGIYIWNCEQSTRLVSLVKAVSPETMLVIGGPEVSHEWETQRIVQEADYLVTGSADLSFAALCRSLLAGAVPESRVIHSEPPLLQRLASPYPLYGDADIAHRLIYVEASRGCPFRCEFCLSALDRSAWLFGLEQFLAEMDRLLQRGARHFKFVDRTFNLKLEQSLTILDFFLARMEPDLFLHFEVIPDRLPEQLQSRLRKFPPGSLQLEIGIQTFNPAVAERISRKQDYRKTRQNLDWLRRETHAHLHADLIVGLPGEGIASFAAGFDQLIALAPQEIQVGILKRLRGTPIVRHSDQFSMRFNPNPPYDILSNDRIDFASMQRLNRFTRYWDLIGNSGRFRETLPALLGEAPFERFMQLSEWLYAATGQVHRIALKRLFELVYQGLVTQLGIEPDTAASLLGQDYRRTGSKGLPGFLQAEGARERAGAAGRISRNTRQLRYSS
ncbi:MAG: DUF4080 domain-containing protein [Chromatiaceae bacterium]|nr:DUF4080 domain-containing protein [Chromatiaceae bacterium]MCP5445961.1 DUF4080 domain-containing protein [Chromatiaceae bacterium]